MINLNFKGPFRLAALVGERMVRGRQRLDHQRELLRVDPRRSPTIIPYAGAKAALNAMSEGLALAFGPTVRVNTLMPGTMLDRHLQGLGHGLRERRAASARAASAVGEPPEIIGAALYLASDASSYTSGATIRVDGGIP